MTTQKHIQNGWSNARSCRNRVGAQMIYRTALLASLTFLCASCAALQDERTSFSTWEGKTAVVEGHGGTRKVVDGMDIWTSGAPPRRFKLIGFIDDSRPGKVIPMNHFEHDVVAKARESGGDAVIFISGGSEFGGYQTWGSANAFGTGNSAMAFGSSTTTPMTTHISRFAVIRYY